MPLQSQLPFQPDVTNYPDKTIYKPNAIDIPSNVPKELAVYCRTEEQFLPLGKTWSDLTPEEMELAKKRYRFDPFKPGIYQGITGYGGSFWNIFFFVQ